MPATIPLKFDRVNKLIIVSSPDTEVTIQQLYDQSQDFLDEPSAMDIQHFVSAGGKEDLGGGLAVGVTLTLLDDWRVQFEARPGPTTERMVIRGGNLVTVNSFNNDPIAPSAFTSVEIRQAVSAVSLNDADVQLLRKVFDNRYEVSESPAPGQLILYDDDDVTVLKTYTLKDKAGGNISIPTGTVSRRSKGV